MSTIVAPARLKFTSEETLNGPLKRPQKFFNPHETPANLENLPEQYGTTNQKVVLELLRINSGEHGYYLADLKYKKYYYCGKEWEDISKKLKEIGIGREDPMKH